MSSCLAAGPPTCCDPVVLGPAQDHLGTARYDDGRPADLVLAHQVYDEYRPLGMTPSEFDAHLNGWLGGC